jgi:hypothetical protein
MEILLHLSAKFRVASGNGLTVRLPGFSGQIGHAAKPKDSLKGKATQPAKISAPSTGESPHAARRQNRSPAPPSSS